MEKDFCLICRDEDDEINFVTRCKHKFHVECLNEWFKAQPRSQYFESCPLCRREISTNQLLEDVYSKRISFTDIIKDSLTKKQASQMVIDDRVVNWIIKLGNTEIISILYNHGYDLIDKATMYGQLHIIKGLLVNDIKVAGTAEKKLQLKLVKYMLKKGSSSIVDAMNSAVLDERLDIIKFAAERGHKCSTACIDQTASRGSLKVLKYLIEKDMYCSQYAIDLAAGNGQVEVVKYLVQKGKPCTSMAIISAILCENLEIVKLLYENKRECTSDAVDMGILKGNLNILKYLLDQGEACPSDAVARAAKYGHLDLVKYLLSRDSNLFSKPLTLDVKKAIDAAAESNYIDIVKYLMECLQKHQQEQQQKKGKRSLTSIK